MFFFRPGQDTHLVYVHHQCSPAAHGRLKGSYQKVKALIDIISRNISGKIKISNNLHKHPTHSQPSWYSINLTLQIIVMDPFSSKYVEQKYFFLGNIFANFQVVNASVNLPIFFFAGKTFREVTINFLR